MVVAVVRHDAPPQQSRLGLPAIKPQSGRSCKRIGAPGGERPLLPYLASAIGALEISGKGVLGQRQDLVEGFEHLVEGIDDFFDSMCPCLRAIAAFVLGLESLFQRPVAFDRKGKTAFPVPLD